MKTEIVKRVTYSRDEVAKALGLKDYRKMTSHHYNDEAVTDCSGVSFEIIVDAHAVRRDED